MTHMDFTYSGLFRESFELTKKHFWFLLGLLAINILLSGITNDVPLVGQIVSLLLSVVTLYVILMIVNGNKPSYRDLLTPIENYQTVWRYFLAMLVMLIVYTAGSLLGYVVAIMVVIFVSARLGFFGFFILEDKNTGAIESLKKSWHMTQGRIWKLLGFFGIAILLNIVGLLLLVIGLLFTVPMTMLATALIYKKWTQAVHHPPEGQHLASE